MTYSTKQFVMKLPSQARNEIMAIYTAAAQLLLVELCGAEDE